MAGATIGAANKVTGKVTNALCMPCSIYRQPGSPGRQRLQCPNAVPVRVFRMADARPVS